MTSLRSSKSKPIIGEISISGDKSMSHRALMLGSVSIGKTKISGLLESDDVLATANALGQMGINVTKNNNGFWEVDGRGVGGLIKPKNVLDLGNSGTAARLLIGLVGSHQFDSMITGDESLISRPMDRIITPLSQMGMNFNSAKNKLPLSVRGPSTLIPIKYKLPVPSAQVKSAILLAGLNAPGQTIIIEPEPTRNHTEIMLREFGANISTKVLGNGVRQITLFGQPELKSKYVEIPGDISSAAFLLVAAIITPGSCLTLERVGLNPLRTGLIKTLKEMGAKITIKNLKTVGGEKVGDIVVKSGPLSGVTIPRKRAPSMIDEYPILSIAAANAVGTTKMRGLAELRVKESDRIKVMAEGLKKCGIQIDQSEDSLVVHGKGESPRGGTQVKTDHDHRIAMSFLILGMNSRQPIAIDDSRFINTSFPNFTKLMNSLGANINVF